jgi:hypothetical protein
MALRINELDIYAGARYEDIRGAGNRYIYPQSKAVSETTNR